MTTPTGSTHIAVDKPPFLSIQTTFPATFSCRALRFNGDDLLSSQFSNRTRSETLFQFKARGMQGGSDRLNDLFRLYCSVTPKESADLSSEPLHLYCELPVPTTGRLSFTVTPIDESSSKAFVAYKVDSQWTIVGDENRLQPLDLSFSEPVPDYFNNEQHVLTGNSGLFTYKVDKPPVGNLEELNPVTVSLC